MEALEEANRVLVNHSRELQKKLKEIETLAAEARQLAPEHLEDVELLDDELEVQT